MGVKREGGEYGRAEHGKLHLVVRPNDFDFFGPGWYGCGECEERRCRCAAFEKEPATYFRGGFGGRNDFGLQVRPGDHSLHVEEYEDVLEGFVVFRNVVNV